MVKKALLAVFGVFAIFIVGCVAYVNLTCEIDFSATALPQVTASTDPAVIARGEYVVHALAHCSACHQGDATGHGPRGLPADLTDLSGGHEFQAGPFGTFRAANLTPDVETGIGGVSDALVARAIRHGVARDGRLAAFMKFSCAPMADEDLTAVVSYLRTVPAKPRAVAKDEWGILAKALASKFKPNPAPTALTYVAPGGISTERGQYLANGPAFCFGCHTTFDAMEGFTEASPRFAGSRDADPDDTDPAFEYAAPNLTPDPATGHITTWSEDQFVKRLKAGRAFPGSHMPWENIQRMTEDDMRSIYRYLHALPPANNETGPTRREAGWKPGAKS